MTSSAEIKKGGTKTAKPKRSPAKAPGVPMAYAAMHETNLALCLASGFLAPRHEKSAAQDHHWKSGGKVIVSGKPVPPGLVASARGGLDYGNIVLAEIATAGFEAGAPGALGQVELRGPLPLSSVKRALFRSATDRDEFQAKVSGYADVPAGIVELVVDAGAFPVEEPTLGLFAEESTEGAAYIVPQAYDKLGGAVIALIHHSRVPGESVLSLELLRDALTCAPGAGAPAEIAGALAGALDPGGGTHGTLVARLVMELLVARQPGSGFNPATFLDELHVAVTKLPASTGAPIDKFVDYAKDILAARKDISDDAHADVPGKIVSRALLLFLLNSDPEKLFSLRKRQNNNLGKAVYSLALFFSGAFKGLAGLPGPWKSADVQAFLGVGVLASKFFHGLACPVSIARTWDQTGSCNEILSCENFALATRLIPTDPAISALLKQVQLLAWIATIDPSTGDLFLTIGTGTAPMQVSARILSSPTFPREPALEVATVCQQALAKKDVARVVAEVNAVSGNKALFARAVPRGKTLAVEIYAFIPSKSITEDSLKDVARAIIECTGSLTGNTKTQEPT